MSSQLPDKLFLKIGEAADVVGVKAHVLRYWETEFPALEPIKTRGAHRLYRRQDVELACLIRRLLHDERYTIPGARKKITQLKREHRQGAKPEATAVGAAAREVSLYAELSSVRAVLSDLLEEIDAIVEDGAGIEHTVRVEQVVPAAVRKPLR